MPDPSDCVDAGLSSVRRVAIVDDDPQMLRIVSLVLGAAGFSARAYQDSAAALADMLNAPPDIAVLDLMMPGIDGLDLCRRLRHARQTAHIRILICSALTRHSDFAGALAAGADGYIPKPFSLEDLTRELTAAPRHRSPAVPSSSST